MSLLRRRTQENLSKLRSEKNWFPTPLCLGNESKLPLIISLPLLQIVLTFGGEEEGYRMRIKIRSFVVLKEEGLVYLAHPRCVLRVFYRRAGAVVYLVSDNLLGNPCTACTTLSLYFQKKTLYNTI